MTGKKLFRTLILSALMLTVVSVGALLLHSPSAQAATSTTAIKIPSCIASNYAGAGITLAWTDPAVTNIQISGAADFSSFAFTKAVAAKTLSTTAPNGFTFFGSALTLNPNTTYYARTMKGSTYVNIGNFTIPSCNTAPAAPTATLPSCIAANYSGSGITLSWQDKTVTTVQISGDSTFATYPNAKTVTAGTTSTTAPGGFSFLGTALTLSPNATYYARVYNGAYSPAITIKIPICNTTTVTAIPSCIPSNYSGTGVSVAWTDSTVQNVQIGTDPGFSNYVFTKAATAGTLSTTAPNGFTFFGSALTLNPNTTYYVRTINGSNVMTSPSTTFTIPTCNPTPAQPIVTPPSCINYGYNGSGISISWPDTTVTSVQISNESTFASSGSYIYSAQVTPGTTSIGAPSGFNFFSTALTLNPYIMYFARVYNGTYSAVVPFYAVPCAKLAVPATVPTPPAGAKKIEIIGDSITQADTTRNSYRRPLWQMLTGANLPVDFVGSQNMNFDLANQSNLSHLGLPPNPDFDLDNDGHYGYTANQVLSNIGIWAGVSQPDYVLLEIGTNDMDYGRTAQATLSDMSGIIDGLRKVNPNVQIFLANLIPSTDSVRQAGVTTLNPLIPGLVAQKTTTASPVTFVDINTGFDASADTVDGTHPNATGEQIVATDWFNAIKGPLSAQTTAATKTQTKK